MYLCRKFGEMKYLQRAIGLIFGLLLMAMPLCSERYFGRVTDLRGVPLFYATVYPLSDPSEGTATNDQGLFTLETEADSASIVAVSYIGYKQLQMPLMALSRDTADVTLIRLEEQPIALEETVVEAKRTRMSKRKKLAQILHLTYQKLTEDLPHDKLRYSVISDVKMNASNAPWGMEQMGADVYEAPGAGAEGKDSVQFVGRWCKRYCSPEVRERIDSVLAHEKDKNRQRMADGVDRGTLTHRALWRMRLDLDHLLDTSDELRRWKMSSEDDTRCVLTYQRKYNMLGIVKATLVENLIVDAYDFRLQSYTVDLSVSLNLPFAMKVEGIYLEWLNLLNNGGQPAEKFRLKKGNMHARLSTIYEERSGVLVSVEKNLVAEGEITDRKGLTLPVQVWATQHVGEVVTKGIELQPDYDKRSEVKRTLVPIY